MKGSESKIPEAKLNMCKVDNVMVRITINPELGCALLTSTHHLLRGKVE